MTELERHWRNQVQPQQGNSNNHRVKANTKQSNRQLTELTIFTKALHQKGVLYAHTSEKVISVRNRSFRFVCYPRLDTFVFSDSVVRCVASFVLLRCACAVPMLWLDGGLVLLKLEHYRESATKTPHCWRLLFTTPTHSCSDIDNDSIFISFIDNSYQTLLVDLRMPCTNPQVRELFPIKPFSFYKRIVSTNTIYHKNLPDKIIVIYQHNIMYLSAITHDDFI